MAAKENTVYEYIVIEFDGPIMNNDKLTYRDVTRPETIAKFSAWCKSYDVKVEDTNPRVIDYKERKEK